MKKIKLKESDLRRIIKKIINEQYDMEPNSKGIIERLEKLGIEDKYLEQALVALTQIEATNDPQLRGRMIIHFKNEINRLLTHFNKGHEESERNTIMSLDILLDKYMADVLPAETTYSLS